MLHEQVFICCCPRLFTTRSHIALFGPHSPLRPLAARHEASPEVFTHPLRQRRSSNTPAYTPHFRPSAFRHPL